MDVAILGKGTSSLITAIVCLLRGHKITIFYDPNTPHISVGESTTPHIAHLIRAAFGICINDLDDMDVVSFKTGVKFINWGSGSYFKHPFGNNKIAFHFSTQELNPFIVGLLEQENVKFIPKRIDSYEVKDDKIFVNNSTYDFLISCVGWSDDSDYLKPIVETVNTAITYVQNSLDIDSTHTIHRATKDGWQFGLPFPKKNITKCGYLFDRNITSIEEIKKEFQEHEIKSIWEWQPRYSKQLIQNNCVAYNGNRLFFFEPLQALSLYYTYRFADLICNYLDNKSDKIKTQINGMYLSEMHQYQQTICWHYRFGSFYKESKFWNNIVEKTNNFLNTTPSGNLDIYYQFLEEDKKYKDTNFSDIGIFNWYDMNYIVSGMNP